MNDIQLLVINFAATYNCNAYGASTYNNNNPCNGTASGGTLADTGQAYFVPLIAGVLLIVFAIILFVRMKRKKHHLS